MYINTVRIHKVIGYMDNISDVLFGVNLVEPIPNGGDGSYRGIRYFSAPQGHGVFIRLSSIIRKLSASELMMTMQQQNKKCLRAKQDCLSAKHVQSQIDFIVTSDISEMFTKNDSYRSSSSSLSPPPPYSPVRKRKMKKRSYSLSPKKEKFDDDFNWNEETKIYIHSPPISPSNQLQKRSKSYYDYSYNQSVPSYPYYSPRKAPKQSMKYSLSDQ